MRCPHCAGEIPAGSRFCGICGRSIAQVPGGRAADEPVWGAGHPARAQSAVDSVSLFQLSSSRSARRAKLALILVLDAILAGAGVVMLLAYLEARRAPRAPARPDRERGKVEVLAPTEVSPPPGAARELSPASSPAPPPEQGTAPDKQPADTSPADSQPAGGEPEPDAPEARARPRPPGTKPRPKARRGGADRSEARRAREREGATLAGSEAEWEPDITSRLREVVDSHQDDLERCYLDATNSDDPDALPEGRIDIRFTLMSDGSAANVTPTANTTGSAELADCVVDLFRGWTFPGGIPEPLELEWPFLFRAPVATAQQ